MMVQVATEVVCYKQENSFIFILYYIVLYYIINKINSRRANIMPFSQIWL